MALGKYFLVVLIALLTASPQAKAMNENEARTLGLMVFGAIVGSGVSDKGNKTEGAVAGALGGLVLSKVLEADDQEDIREQRRRAMREHREPNHHHEWEFRRGRGHGRIRLIAVGYWRWDRSIGCRIFEQSIYFQRQQYEPYQFATCLMLNNIETDVPVRDVITTHNPRRHEPIATYLSPVEWRQLDQSLRSENFDYRRDQVLRSYVTYYQQAYRRLNGNHVRIILSRYDHSNNRMSALRMLIQSGVTVINGQAQAMSIAGEFSSRWDQRDALAIMGYAQPVYQPRDHGRPGRRH